MLALPCVLCKNNNNNNTQIHPYLVFNHCYSNVHRIWVDSHPRNFFPHSNCNYSYGLGIILL